MSEIEETKVVETKIEDSEDVEKPKKERKPYVMTEARKQAFERCKLKRQEKIKAREDEKLVKASEIITEKRQRDKKEEVKQEVKQDKPKKSKKTKKVVVYQSSSSEYDTDTSIEIEVIKKPKTKSKSKPPTDDSHNTAINTLISWV